MFRPTDNLRAEHDVLRAGTAVLAAIGRAVGSGHPLPVRDSATIIRFLREFVVGVHFHKEGTWVLPALAVHGDERTAELVGRQLRRQEEVVELIHTLMLFWEPTSALSAAERAGFAETVGAIASRLQQMCTAEEAQLFAMCEAKVPADDRLEWREQFARLERERGGCDRWLPRLQALAAKWHGAA
ncbi:MAG: hemerythrin domain-containing protein [Planctomycetota bacterium]